MSRGDVLERIRRMGRGREGLFRAHLRHPDLYARARRQFGSWSAAVTSAGLDHDLAVRRARARAMRARRRGARAA